MSKQLDRAWEEYKRLATSVGKKDPATIAAYEAYWALAPKSIKTE